MKAMLPFYALFVGDGSSTSFVLDISKDPWYIADNISGFNVSESLPSSGGLYPGFDPKLSPSAIVNPSARNASNNSNFDPTTTAIDQYQITFTLNSAPASGVVVVIQGFIEY